ncbi:uncharacterized protein BXZ73DRAFT_78861 [Epithele typhae]|uniref:uncharacterized protein n=1 Tax=Epithele typhae TaxID=378194 RepID=UPI002007A7F9|nr:uncharacterized protein BXZ73DRAFT_78861 [Epithele typhae]KAH9925879.1 hypothetical protein BXZ73DRAFT_78861 [Epithele typhae]
MAAASRSASSSSHGSDASYPYPDNSAMHAPEDTRPFARVNALLVALHPLLEARAGSHIAWQTPYPSLPHTRLLDTVADLCTFHPACARAATALEATSTQITLFVAASPQSPSDAITNGAYSGSCSACVGSLNSRFIPDFESWVDRVWLLARAPRQAGFDGVTDLPDSQLVIAVYKACYPVLRDRIRGELRVWGVLRRLEEWRQEEAVIATLPPSSPTSEGPSDGMDWASAGREEGSQLPSPHSDALTRLCRDIRILLKLTKEHEIREPYQLLAIHQACRRVAAQMRVPDFRTFLGSIYHDAIPAIDEACTLSRLVNNLIALTRSHTMVGALAVPWHVVWLDTNGATSSYSAPAPAFQATLDSGMLADWVAGIDGWKGSDLGVLPSCPPDVTRWPWSEIVRPLGKVAVAGLVREEGRSGNGVRFSRYVMEPCPKAQDFTSTHGHTHGSVALHCETLLLAHLHNSHAVSHAYISVAGIHPAPPLTCTTPSVLEDVELEEDDDDWTPACYACTALARTLGDVGGSGFILRGRPDADFRARTRVVLPWTCPTFVDPAAPVPTPKFGALNGVQALSSSSSSLPISASGLVSPQPMALDSTATNTSLALEGLMEDLLLRDLQSVLVREAEGAVVRQEITALCQLPLDVALDVGTARARTRDGEGLRRRLDLALAAASAAM